jgi:hypothetical protein
VVTCAGRPADFTVRINRPLIDDMVEARMAAAAGGRFGIA